MGIAKMLLRTMLYFLTFMVLFIILGFAVYLTTMLREAIGEYPTQIITASLCFTVFMVMMFRRISKDNDLHRDITADLNKSEGEFDLTKATLRYMKKDGIKEIICFMAGFGIVNLFYLGINIDRPNVMIDVFYYMYNILKFIYSPYAIVGTYNIFLTLNYIFVVLLFIVFFIFAMTRTIAKCEENRLHKNSIIIDKNINK
jgi:hypothetical protein